MKTMQPDLKPQPQKTILFGKSMLVHASEDLADGEAERIIREFETFARGEAFISEFTPES